MSAEEEKEPPIKPEFNEEEILQKFDDDFPEIEIPNEVIAQANNDWILTEEEEAKLIEDYLAGKPE